MAAASAGEAPAAARVSGVRAWRDIWGAGRGERARRHPDVRVRGERVFFSFLSGRARKEGGSLFPGQSRLRRFHLHMRGGKHTEGRGRPHAAHANTRAHGLERVGRRGSEQGASAASGKAHPHPRSLTPCTHTTHAPGHARTRAHARDGTASLFRMVSWFFGGQPGTRPTAGSKPRGAQAGGQQQHARACARAPPPPRLPRHTAAAGRAGPVKEKARNKGGGGAARPRLTCRREGRGAGRAGGHGRAPPTHLSPRPRHALAGGRPEKKNKTKGLAFGQAVVYGWWSSLLLTRRARAG